ncbi:MAG TPA: LPS assembly protein LptD [Terracidiphilus sp.]|nr:LPS assembly protein LptD [Terracidiphilus sp.]
MHPRNFVFITLLALCHPQVRAQVLTNALPLPTAQNEAAKSGASAPRADQLPDDPDQQSIPVAQPEPAATSGIPVTWTAGLQTWAGDIVTLNGGVEFHYRDYVIRADTVVYNRATTELTAEGHLQVTGGPEDVFVTATKGDMRLDEHTARFFNVNGSMGVRRAGRRVVYSTANPFLFSGRVLIQTGQGNYRIVDGTMTNCRLPRPDWELIARSIKVEDKTASAANSFFKLLGIPIFYLPYLRHPVDENGRVSGFLIPVVGNSSIRGFTFGEQVYFVLNRSMDMEIGSEYYSKRGFAPNGDFRYKGPGLDHLNLNWKALLDRGVVIPPATTRVNQGGVDVAALGRKDLSPETRIAGNVEYLSSYVYRLVFNDNYSQAVNSEVHSDVSLTHARNGFIPSGYFERLQTFAGTTSGDEVRLLHLPALRYDVLDRPLGKSSLYWSFSSSMGYLGRSEPDFHARNVGRIDVRPHISLPFVIDGWSFIPEAGLRETFYSGSQYPDLTGTNGGVPTISHDPLARFDAEASFDLRPPALERDFQLKRWNRTLRHVFEPEFTYHFVGGIGQKARNTLLFDTADIATNTNEAGYSLTQRFYVRPQQEQPCEVDGSPECAAKAREWASWQIAQKFFINPDFGGAIIPNRRNVLDSTLDLSGIAFLTVPRNVSPVISRMRFEAIDNLRVEWDMDYDPRDGRLGADNLYTGYSWGRTTVGVGHSLLNAVDEQGTAASIIQSQQLQPFLQIGKSNGAGFNLAANGGYDFVHGALQYAGIQAVYNWDCCGLTIGYRRFELGTSVTGTVGRDETEWLYSFTLANFGSVGDISRNKTVFRDPSLPPAY